MFKVAQATLAEAVGNAGGDLSALEVRVPAATFHPDSETRVPCSGGASASLNVSPSIGVTPKLEAHFTANGLTSASFSLTGDASLSLTAHMHASAGCKLSKRPLLGKPLRIGTFEGFIGPVPVVVALEGQIMIDGEIGASADTTTNVTASASLTGGVSYTRGAKGPHGPYSATLNPAGSFDFAPPTVSSAATASIHIEPEIQAKLYGVAGPKLSLTTGLELNADPAMTPYWWTLDAPFEIDASLTAPALKLDSGKLALYRANPNPLRVTQAPGPFGSALPDQPPVTPPPGQAPPTLPGQAGALARISAGSQHTCAVLSTNRVDCWGGNDYGQLGNGTTVRSGVPVSVSGITNATAIATGNYHSCVLLSAGVVKCWGNNGSGQTGNAPVDSIPSAVTGINNAIAIAAGGEHSCALLSTGRIECWGNNVHGELGDGTVTTSTAAVAVSGITNATAIMGAANHSCALLATGAVKCWGINTLGQLGNGTVTDSSTPVAVSGITAATAIAAGSGGAQSCALLAGGHIDCWGSGVLGQLGDGNAIDSSTPVAVSGIANATAIAAGGAHSCALLSTRAVDCWGLSSSGQLGNGTTTGPELCVNHQLACATTPVAVSGITNATEIAEGASHSCALLSTGQIECWGDNGLGQLGDGAQASSSTPVAVLGIP